MSQISLEEGIEMIGRYKDNRDRMLNSTYQMKILTLSETFEKSDIEALINQPECQKLRAYFGMDPDNNIRMIMVGVNGENEDILNEGEEIIIENGERCPDDCPPPSPINP
jgi:hypothetical protein